jgi:ankyrin repeat protein
MELLVAAGAPAGLADENGITPLMEAARHGHLEAVQLLLRLGVSTGKRDHSGHTALDLAARAGHDAVANLLHNAPATTR